MNFPDYAYQLLAGTMALRNDPLLKKNHITRLSVFSLKRTLVVFTKNVIPDTPYLCHMLVFLKTSGVPHNLLEQT